MRLHTSTLATAAVFVSSVIAFPSSAFETSTPKPWGFFVNNTIYQTTGRESITYPRYTELQDGTIIATASLSGNSPNYFPIFESKDGGATWKHVSDLRDTVNGFGMSAQPALTELTEPMGGYPAGTILGSGNSWGPNSTRIDLYASKDRARTWQFVSHIAEGGRPNTTNGATPIWEPYLLQYQGQLIAYYSDQRDPKHGQKLAHQTSTDLKTWGPVVNDVAYEQYIARPGMTVVDYIPPLKKWILVHELPIGNSSSYGSNYPVYYVMADSPLDFRKSVGRPIVINNSTVPNASPYVVWSPIGGPQGTIIVSDADRRQVYTNSHGGALDKWEEHATPAGAVYSRAIQIFKKRPDHLMIYGGETYDDFGKGLHTPFSATVIDLRKVLKAPAQEG
ncbi:glycoside hydrolase family 93 protein [Bipolaris maydis ATCC 48331]|uniref:Glycoside hydrolase family 93 protein n=2 Tax=Cochliobolus heterostrophus TaxID=5016 RepID=N4X7B3_COCH4|nr:glycoside hydrolase family 93 protein [Bipolaris maydis ATCC 48331]ENI01117.1 glycoside hydrolase family 93 protein [Bipolaris maydis ATCC 48331]KAJ5031727.1 glycoside hydrolase [Bipolaris maydis]KAJ6273415.1 glycoside hydrolase [Bipolaris maydis]